MRTEQRMWNTNRGWTAPAEDGLGGRAQLALVFGDTDALLDPARYAEVRSFYPQAEIFGCSTSGEIQGGMVLDDSIVVTAVAFEHTRLAAACIEVAGAAGSKELGSRLAGQLAGPGLRHVLVLSDGLLVNGSELASGLTGTLPPGVAVTGGLAGDGSRFARTCVACGGPPRQGLAAALGLYSDRLRVGFGSMGGWDPFGPERLVTRVEGNVLFELDGRSALELYKTYLGKHSEGLPATALLFPLSIRAPGCDERALVRTVLSVNEQAQSMTFAGDIPAGSYARFMKANLDRLVDGSQGAAGQCLQTGASHAPELALLISCVGRKLVFGQRVEEEVEAVQEVFGPGTALAGFYSYGEICPARADAPSELHNQTMTITTFSER